MNKPLVRRTTAMTDALVSAASAAGIETANIKLPRKTEPAWTVTRKRKRKARK